MLNIGYEFRKGILFIRLSGVLTKNTVDKLQNEVTDMIKDNGIRNVVFNISDLNVIDIKGINSLLYNYELCKNNQGQSLLCGLKNSLVRHRIENSRLLKYMNETSDELSAFNIINL
ncbi:MAG: STAS domain-containing protein [Firmicutes bacterium]|nr:STAS domain-containing protein [Bacillota bacterium]